MKNIYFFIFLIIMNVQVSLHAFQLISRLMKLNDWFMKGFESVIIGLN